MFTQPTLWMRQANIETLPQPSNSSDTKPINNMWEVIVKHLYRQSVISLNSEELWQGIQEEWAQEENFVVPFMSMSRRIQTVIDADGDCTRC